MTPRARLDHHIARLRSEARVTAELADALAILCDALEWIENKAAVTVGADGATVLIAVAPMAAAEPPSPATAAGPGAAAGTAPPRDAGRAC